MHPKKDSFSVVILGSWNPSIFHQKWILNNLVEAGTENVTIAYPLDDPTAPRKINFDGINLFPGRKQILLQPDTTGSDGLQKCAHLLVKIMDLLSHTPLGPCGINFSFEESNKLEKIYNLLNLSDKADIDNKMYALENVIISRKFKLGDGNFLNLSISDNNGKGEIGFNYHYELNDKDKYCGILAGDHVAERFKEAITFCETVYGLNLEEAVND